MTKHSSLTRRTALRGAGVAGVLTAAGLLVPTAAHAYSGSSMAAIQKSLKGLYYYAGRIDGWRGAMTTTAVKSFQKDRGLVVDGDPGPVTQDALDGVVTRVQSAVGVLADADYGSVTIGAVKKVQRSQGLVVDGYAGEKTMAALGVRRITSGAASVVALQKSLHGLYYYDGLIDGNLGTMTVTAIREFQRDRDLVDDGYAGPISRGELDTVVEAVQGALGLLADADYGSVTIGAVKKFQRAQGLVVDGRSGPLTMAALGVKRTAGSSPGTDDGAASVQKSLWGLFYYDGAINGNLDSATTSAIRAFQKDRALVVDGYAGPISRAELDTVVEAVQTAVSVTADADYGDSTIDAVKGFQKAEGLVVDGRSGPETMAALGVKRSDNSQPTPDYSGELIALDQGSTGPEPWENCGPTSAVITLYALGTPPPGTPVAAVSDMYYASNVHEPQYGTGSADIIHGLASYGTDAALVTFAGGLSAARAGRPVILNVNLGYLRGGSSAGVPHWIAAMGVDSSGNYYVSDPANADEGIRTYTSARLNHAARKNRAIVVG